MTCPQHCTAPPTPCQRGISFQLGISWKQLVCGLLLNRSVHSTGSARASQTSQGGVWCIIMYRVPSQPGAVWSLRCSSQNPFLLLILLFFLVGSFLLLSFCAWTRGPLPQGHVPRAGSAVTSSWKHTGCHLNPGELHSSSISVNANPFYYPTQLQAPQETIFYSSSFPTEKGQSQRTAELVWRCLCSPLPQDKHPDHGGGEYALW